MTMQNSAAVLHWIDECAFPSQRQQLQGYVIVSKFVSSFSALAIKHQATMHPSTSPFCY